MRKLLLCISALYISLSCMHEKKSIAKEENSEVVFEKIPSSTSGIDFANTITHDVATKENLFDYDYFYNGAGVGMADINNDGLLDLFFCGNQTPNKLYLNKGNLKFEDISKKAGINKGKQWANGVTFADVNNDGWLDIYVSQGGPKNRQARKNLLFINQKDNTFKEHAETLGLADQGISTQAVFFDYDKDGDLDCLVSNENELYGLGPIPFYKKVLSDPELLYYSCAHLYKNENGKFVDVTQNTNLMQPAFGLGAIVSDIDDDGWLDIYIANDYFIPDAIYINNKDGSFTDRVKELTNQVSFYGMGVDMADANNDGLQDIFVLDMASSDHVRSKTLMASMNVTQFDLLTKTINFPHQYMFNSLQLNVGNNKFHNISQLSGLSKTDWSWAGLLVDLNNDEDKDIYVTNGYRRYALDNDSKLKIKEEQKRYGGKVPLRIKKQLYDALPSEKLSNILFEGGNGLHFENATKAWGLYDPSFSNGATVGDLDNDGDLEIVVNNMDEPAFLYKNLSNEKHLGNYLTVNLNAKLSECFAKVSLHYDGKQQLVETKRVRGYLSALENNAHFGLASTKTIDTVRVVWPSGLYEEKYDVAANRSITFNETDATTAFIKREDISDLKHVEPKTLGLEFVHTENEYSDFESEILLPYKQSTLGPFITKGDLNGDGKEDLFIGGAAGQAGALFIQNSKGFERVRSKALETDAPCEDMEALFVDIDNDGDIDLYVVSGGNEFDEGDARLKDRLYLNIDGTLQKADDSEHLSPYFGKSIAAIDYDKDGDKDLVIGNRIITKNYPRYAPSIIYENVNGTLKDVTENIAPSLKDIGIINKVIATDFNNDGWEDLIAVGEWSHVALLRNERGTFKDVSGELGLKDTKGWWFTVKETDLNNDGFKDYVVGNVGLNIKFKASFEKPLKVFANDFDNNGTPDIVLSKKYKDDYVPVRGRECSSQQMPFIAEKFQSYSEFANASLVDVYGKGIDTAYKAEVNEFRSMVLLNDAGQRFKMLPLPEIAQTFPLMDASFFDLNKDGFEDVILVGNIYNTEVETPRLDAGAGLVLYANGIDGYETGLTSGSHLHIQGNLKSSSIIKHQILEKYLLLCGRNDGQVAVKHISQ
ncbi:VCBS repeat-containing protein [Sungkyunkwania multivorans]|uniref:VCBS repeat-containing protein n=1 Tax=Sungkyunkwania multivorans TaxID=1173618 RepID=A0ABW3CVA5_9FLAO